MTHREFIYEAIKQLFNAELDETTAKNDAYPFKRCWGFNCPERDYDCDKCPYKDFWEKEV